MEHFCGSNMDFRMVTLVVMLSLTTPVHGRTLERDTSPRATCTAPVVTKGETAEVTCHYPLEVKQPGEIVAVSVERYPITSSYTGFPRSEYLLDCMWYEDFTCTLDKEEHRVEGKEVVVTIKNVNEDNQGRYLCKMMVKDGPNVHGDPCRLLVNGTNPSDLLPQTTDPALNQQASRDSDTSSAGPMAAGSIAGIVGCAIVVVAVVVVVVAVLVRKKRGNGPPAQRDQLLGRGDNRPSHRDRERPGARDERNNGDVNHGNGPPAVAVPLLGRGENQLPYQDPDRPGARDERNNGDVNQQQGSSDDRPESRVRAQVNRIEGKGAPSTSHPSGHGHPPEHPERQQLQGLGAENPEEEAPGDNGDDNHGNGPPAERDPLLGRGNNRPPHRDRERPGARDERHNGDVNQQQGSSDDRPESWVGAQVNRIEGKGAPSTSHPRASKETEETDKADGEEEKEDEENETDERQERKQDEEEKENEENETDERQERKQDEEEKENEENETDERQERKQDEEEKENEENETDERQERKQDEEEKENEENETDERQERKQDEEEKENEENMTGGRQEKKQ